MLKNKKIFLISLTIAIITLFIGCASTNQINPIPKNTVKPQKIRKELLELKFLCQSNWM